MHDVKTRVSALKIRRCLALWGVQVPLPAPASCATIPRFSRDFHLQISPQRGSGADSLVKRALRPKIHHNTVHKIAITAPEPSAASQPKCLTKIGTSSVEAIPPRMPA